MNTAGVGPFAQYGKTTYLTNGGFDPVLHHHTKLDPFQYGAFDPNGDQPLVPTGGH